MKKTKFLSYSIILLFLAGCTMKSEPEPDKIASVQLLDRNGFSETINHKKRLETFEKSDFLSPQPYQKILRVYGRSKEGKIHSKITSYHANGQVWQFLEVIDGRANGQYKEWHPNGNLKLEATVVEGMADLTEMAQLNWQFDGMNRVWDEQGNRIAEIYYEKGILEDTSRYYHPNGALLKSIPYIDNAMHGTLEVFSDTGIVLEKTTYTNGLKHGPSLAYWDGNLPQHIEDYNQDLLQTGTYFDKKGVVISEVKKGEGTQCLFNNGTLYSRIEYVNGVPCGRVSIYRDDGTVERIFSIRDGKKHGEEWEFYPGKDQPKLVLFWNADVIQGLCKTWYDNGVLESQKEMNSNKKHGLNFAWYKDGQLMLAEEYENDRLVKGNYFKKGDKNPVSKVDSGIGQATLFDADGHFIQRIKYEKGVPQFDEK